MFSWAGRTAFFGGILNFNATLSVVDFRGGKFRKVRVGVVGLFW